MEFIPLLVLGVVGVWYLVYFKRGGGKGNLHRHFQLAAGETSTMFWSAEFATEISIGEKVGTAALGLLAGAVVGGVGIASVRPRGISLVLTNLHRLVMCIENEDGSTTLCSFRPGDGLAIQAIGEGNKRLQGGPTVILRLSKAGTNPVDMLIHHSAQQPLMAWAGTQHRRPLTLAEATAAAVKALDETGPPEEAGALVIVDSQETEFGWIFRSQSRAYAESGDPRHQIPGIGPLVVLRDTGETKFLPTFMPPERAIEQFTSEWRNRRGSLRTDQNA